MVSSYSRSLSTQLCEYNVVCLNMVLKSSMMFQVRYLYDCLRRAKATMLTTLQRMGPQHSSIQPEQCEAEDPGMAIILDRTVFVLTDMKSEKELANNNKHPQDDKSTTPKSPDPGDISRTI